MGPLPNVALATTAFCAFLALACRKRTYVVEDAAPAASSAAHVFTEPTAPSAAASARPVDDAGEPVPPTPLAKTCSGVSLAIVSVRNEGGWLNPVVELRNDSAEHVPIMLTGDGSSAGRRNPTLTFALTPNDAAPQMGCGNMNGLSAGEIVFVAPGEHAKLGWVSPPTPAKPGRYTLRATYRNDPTSNDLGDNREGPETDRLIARVRKTVPCTLVSNTLSFSWP